MSDLPVNQIITGDCLEVMRDWPDNSIHCCVTSPPYWGLRDYGVAGQLGLEPTPDEYVAKMVAVCREVRRVLRDDGTFWLNLGDSYASGKGTCYNPGGGADSYVQDKERYPLDRGNKSTLAAVGLKPKDLVGIPWRVAFALQADGWWLRQDIIWAKPNPMPESVTDRCTKAHEYIFMLTKSARYWYDAEAVKEKSAWCAADGTPLDSWGRKIKQKTSGNGETSQGGRLGVPTTLGANRTDGCRNRRSVWTIAMKPYSGAHFATFPPDLIKPCILAGCPDKACPECGAGWERVVERGTAPHPNRWSKTNDAQQFSAGENEYGEGGGLGVAHTSTTVGWRPTCACYDDAYRAEFQRTRNQRKRYQQDAADRWFRRARKHPGDDSWRRDPGLTFDPFMGAGTTALVAKRLGCNYVGVELNEEYAGMARKRVANTEANLFAGAADAQ